METASPVFIKHQHCRKTCLADKANYHKCRLCDRRPKTNKKRGDDLRTGSRAAASRSPPARCGADCGLLGEAPKSGAISMPVIPQRRVTPRWNPLAKLYTSYLPSVRVRLPRLVGNAKYCTVRRRALKSPRQTRPISDAPNGKRPRQRPLA